MARELRDEQLGTAVPEEAPPPQNPDSVQIIPDANLQRVAVNIVESDFDAAKQAREGREYGTSAKGEKLDFDKWLKDLKDLYFGRRIPKTVPWQFCSNRSMMIAMAIVETLQARIFPAIYNEDLVRFRPTEVNDTETVERINKFMHWWVRVRAKLSEFFDRWTRSIICFGYAATESGWDVWLIDKGESTQPQPMVDQTTGQPVIDPMTGQPQMQPGQKVLDRIESSRSDLIPPEDIFLQPGSTSVQRDSVIIRMKYLYRELEEMERNGQAVNIAQPTAEGAPTLKDLLPVDAPSGEMDDAQREQLKDIKRRNKEVICLKWYGAIDLDGDGFPEQVRIIVDPERHVYLGGVALKDISKRGIRHLDITQFLPRVDEPQGLTGLGILEQVKELALEIDAIFNQMTDANSISILRPGFYDPGGDLDAPALKLAPNKWTPVSNPQQNIFVPQIDIPTERLINAIRMVLEFIERLTAASAYVMGKESEIVGGSGTATRTQAIVGASDQRHAIPVQRLRQGAARIITHHLDLVQMNLPPGMESRILGEKGDAVFKREEVTREALAGEFDAYLLPDESLGSKEAERQLSQLLYTLLTNNLIVASDPAKLYRITADVLKAWGKEPEAYLGPKPALNEAKSPLDENTLILQGDYSQVKVTLLDNHLEHILTHQAIAQSPTMQLLSPEQQAEVLQFTQQHIQQHMQMLALVMAVAAKQKGGGNAAGGQGTQRGAGATASGVGPEPVMGAPQSPLAAAGAASRGGESQPVA